MTSHDAGAAGGAGAVARRAGPRASRYLVRGGETLSALGGGRTPVEDDVGRMAVPVLRHRIVPGFNAEADDVSSVGLIDQLLDEM